jgi:NTE family protein
MPRRLLPTLVAGTLLANAVLPGAVLALAACGSSQRLKTMEHPPLVAEEPAAPAAAAPEPRIALVLGGGAARGFAHIGVIRVLEQERIPIDQIVGTSVGSLIGALYAADRNSFDLEWTAFQLEQDDIFDFRLANAVMGMGYARGEKLEAFVRSKVKVENVEQLAIPFAAVATDLNWGERVVIDRGSVAKAVRASSAIPGIFEPVLHQGKLLVDGGVVDNIPIEVARARGADLVVAVDIGEKVGNTNIKGIVDVILQSTNIMFAVNTSFRRRGADVLVTPNVDGVGMLDFTQKKRCMQAGIDAARAAVPGLREAIEAWKARKAKELAPRS